MKKANGFSLIEVLLAITILSTLAVLSTQALSRALKAKTKIQIEVDDVSSLRDSMRMIRTDLNLAYHHRDFEKEINEIIKKPAAAKPGVPGAPQAPQQPAVPRVTKRIEPDTHFVGTDDKMSFVTMNNGRMTANLMQADFIEVGYSLKECRNLSKADQSSKCLFRRTQSVLDDDVTTGGEEIVMLENITEFKLRYIADIKQDWVQNWNSTSNGSDATMRGRYPEVVEVSITIDREIDKKKKTYSMQFMIPIHFPNNSEQAPATGAPNPTTGNNLGGGG